MANNFKLDEKTMKLLKDGEFIPIPDEYATELQKEVKNESPNIDFLIKDLAQERITKAFNDYLSALSKMSPEELMEPFNEEMDEVVKYCMENNLDPNDKDVVNAVIDKKITDNLLQSTLSDKMKTFIEKQSVERDKFLEEKASDTGWQPDGFSEVLSPANNFFEPPHLYIVADLIRDRLVSSLPSYEKEISKLSKEEIHDYYTKEMDNILDYCKENHIDSRNKDLLNEIIDANLTNEILSSKFHEITADIEMFKEMEKEVRKAETKQLVDDFFDRQDRPKEGELYDKARNIAEELGNWLSQHRSNNNPEQSNDEPDRDPGSDLR